MSKRFVVSAEHPDHWLVEDTSGEYKGEHLDGFGVDVAVDIMNKQHEEITELREAMKRMMADMIGGFR